MRRTPVSAIVLAGGRSSRFGRDKLAEPIDGRSLLQHAVDAVRPFASEVLVVAAPGGGPSISGDIRLVHDPTPFEGPLAGLRVGLAAAHTDVALVVGGDMPDLVPRVLQTLLDELELDAEGAEAVVLDHDGRGRPLPMAVLRRPALAAATRLIEAGERRLRALSEALATTVIAEAVWRSFDPDGATLHDIDTPDDLR
jgi:molybdopterin-guanine dinucleotide biosynthesis protein A